MEMKVIYKNLDEIIPYVNNPRKNDKSISFVAASIKEFGWKQPIVLDKNSIIIAGQTRYLAAKKLKLKKVPVLIADDLTEAQVKAYRIADNKTAEFSEWDIDLLKIETEELEKLKEIGKIDFDIRDFGFSEEEMQSLLSNLNNEDDIEVTAENDRIPSSDEIGTEVSFGQVWKLGNNILICGDSLEKETREKAFSLSKEVLSKAEIDMVFTDPPYGMNWYKGRSNYKVVRGNDGSKEEIHKFYNIIPILRENYIWGMVENIINVKFKPVADIIWKKNNFGLGRGYHHQYEMCFYYGEFSGHDSNVWEVKRDTNYLHPTQKPVDLCIRAIKNSRPKGVIDFYAGSGSTLIACEKAKIPSISIEYEEDYCGVIIERWEKLAEGNKAIFLGNLGEL